MSKKSGILIALGCLAIGLGIGILWRPSTPVKIDIDRGTPTSTAQGGAAPTSTAPSVTARTFSEDTSDYSVDVQYPELQNLSDTRIQDKVNNRIKSDVFAQIAGFHSEAASNPVAGSADANAPRSMLAATYQYALLTNSFFSGYIAYSDYSAGAAHPNNYMVALNYDLRTGVAVGLDQLLQSLHPSSGYFARLGDYVQADLIKQLGNDADTIGAIRDGAAPTPDNYKDYTLGQDGITIHFDPYQVAAYAAGTPSVKISYSDLVNNILKPATPPAAYWWLQ